ncbi:uncharacterized protein CLAFUR5_06652 [Fulvia fulva]|uniref:Uncharacterized protein n=1 Tax=Passalora fulva TaxID=5499 RepID=A0A9Q8URB1_PASFU|nr:uncharacterized protein CLAFUR5_06652 [Fulvia fulva]UJO19527.1 hypothetical protein CLAFUR5_06652 [Fulvia fulva]
MDDDDFDDLFSEVDFLPGSSQVSLTDAAANMSFGGSVGDEAYASEDNLAAPEDTDMLDQWPEEAFEDQEPPLKLEPNAHAIAKIEAVFELMADAMLNDKNELSVTLKVRNSKAKNQHTSPDIDDRTKRICFPGKTADEAWRFGEITFVGFERHRLTFAG